MSRAGFERPRTYKAGIFRHHGGSYQWLAPVLLSVIASGALAFGQDQESLVDQGFSASPLPEVQHAREAARSVYPTRAQRLDLGDFSTQEEDKILELLSVSTVNYTGIYREVRLQRANWALVKQEDGIDVWQAHIHSPAAVSLGVYLRNFHLDPGMAVKLYSLTDEEDPVEEHTGEGLAGNRDGFWSYPMSGDAIVVEFRTPTASGLEPDAFPFAVEKASHTFKDRNGELPGTQLQKFQARSGECQYHDKTENTADFVNSDMPAHVRKASLGTVLICVNGEHASGCGTGSLLKNKSGDGALYALSVWHLFVAEVDDPNADDKPYINSDFSVALKNEAKGRARARGSRFIAGSVANDWGLVRIEGQFSGWGDYELLDWKTHSPEVFDGYVLHHSYLLAQQYSPFRNAYLQTSSLDASKSASCSGAVCARWFRTPYTGYRAEFGGSGSPAFYEDTSSVVGVSVGFGGCNGIFAGMGNIYKNPRVFNALNYGDAYFHGSQFPYVDPEFTCPVNSQAMAGSGTESDPYQVENICHLRGVGASPQSHYVQIKDIEALATRGWRIGFTPIRSFSGTYDGNGYKITDLKIGVAGGESENVGLFGRLQGGLLKRVKLVNVLANKGVNVGSLVGLNDQGTIEDSEVAGGRVVGSRTIGGLVGLNQGGVIRNSKAQVSVSGVSQVGGLVGQNDGGTIEGSRALGGVSGRNQVGGLVGLNQGGVIRNSEAQGWVSGNSQAGGLVGQNDGGTIEGSRALGSVAGRNQVGGLVGLNQGGVIRNSKAQVSVSGVSQVGGLVGQNDGGTIEGSRALGGVSGRSQVGGLVGVNKGSIRGSHARGTLVVGYKQAGGLVGRHLGGTISDSYATGSTVHGKGGTGIGGLVGVNEGNASIVNTHASMLVLGMNQVGGLVGENKGTISNSYVWNGVSGVSQTGGLVGENSGSVRNAYSAAHIFKAELPGRLVGVNSGTIASSYASRLGDGDSLVGVNDGAVQDSGLRTVEQMECSIEPVNLCLAADVYLDWDTRLWFFGYSRMLPVLRAVADIPAVPLAIRADWDSKGKLMLQWEHRGAAVKLFEVEVDGTIRHTYASRFVLDVTLMAELRERYAGGSEIRYSIRGRNFDAVGDAASGSFHLMNVPGAVEIQTASGLSTVQVTIVGAANDGYGSAPNSSAYGKPADGVSLDLAYRVRLFSKGLLKEEQRMTQQGSSNSTVVEFSGLEGGSRYEVRIFAENKAGAGPTVEAPVFTYVAACPWAAVITAAGSGSEDDPWQVGTLCQLQEIRYDTAAHYRLADNIDAGQSHGWRDGKGFPPIEYFSGSLDGSGHSVLNLLINPGSVDHVGLFGRLSGGALKSLALVDVTVRGRDAVGALAGRVGANGSIKGSTVTGLAGGRDRVGGMAGENHGLIKFSHSESTVAGTVSAQGHGNMIGGLVGKNFPGARIRSSHAGGSVSGANHVGGLVGLNQAPLHHSHARSTVIGHHSVGGLAGSNHGSINGSYSAGAVNGKEAVGGLVGHNESSLRESYATGQSAEMSG